MNFLRSLFSFRRFSTRLIVFLWMLLLPVLGGIFFYVNRNNTDYTEETINSYLELGARVFDFTREQHINTLIAITTSLTWDFGFRTAYASQDAGTLFDAALNVLERSQQSTDMLMIVDLDYQVVIDTETQGFNALENEWRELLDDADASDDGTADMIVAIEGRPFQLIALPLYLPRQVAWIVGGFELDADFVTEVGNTTVSDVSIVRLGDGSASVLASTLPADWQPLLTRELSFSGSAFDTLQRIEFDEEEFTSLMRRLYGGPDEPLQIIAVIQRSYDENNANVVQFRNLLIQFYLLVFVVSLIAVLVLARSITNPLSKLASLVKRIDEGDYGRVVTIDSRDELGALAESVNSMARGLAEKEKVRDLLGKVVSQEIAEQLLSNPVELGGEERIVTVLFSDIRGFTTYCEGLSPQQVLGELNKVLTAISDIIEKHAGVVDKYNGDAVMALFGAPIQGPNDAAHAMAAALDIVQAMQVPDAQLRACVGINTGLVVAGNLGSSNRLNYSVIGDTVNLAARLEGLTRLYNVSSILSEASRYAAPGFVYRELDCVRVVGKTEAVRIYELIGREGEVSAATLDELATYARALEHYRRREWQAASEEFSQLARRCDNSALCEVFLERIAGFRERPPEPGWDGVHTLGTK